MNQFKLNLESEKLSVDYIQFNITNVYDLDLLECLSEPLINSFGFNATSQRGSNGKERAYRKKLGNPYKVCFQIKRYNSEAFWEGTEVHFAGESAAELYRLIKSEVFDWSFLDFPEVKLGRFDICHTRKLKPTEQSADIEQFMESCLQQIRSKSTRQRVQWYRGKEGLSLNINKRRISPNFYRVYEKGPDKLRFELEMRKKSVDPLHNFLFSNRFEVLEEEVSKQFLKLSRKYLDTNYGYTDWLVDSIRRNYLNSDYPLVSSYVSNNFQEQKFFFEFCNFYLI